MKFTQSLFVSVLTTLFILMIGCTPAFSIVKLSNQTINDAVQYGMTNRSEDLQSFLDGNWIDGPDGALLNIYTPYIEIARSAAHHKSLGRPTPENIDKMRGYIDDDIDYIWHHPIVKFLVSLYGDDPSFAKQYFAVIEGVGDGRSFKIYPENSIQQYLAHKEADVTIHPYTAINAYHFNFDDIAPLDEFVLKLYGKGVQPVEFRIYNTNIQ